MLEQNGVADPTVQTPQESGKEDEPFGSLFSNSETPDTFDPHLSVEYNGQTQEQAPVQPPVESAPQLSNDEKRYQYWQSIAAQRDNKLKEVAPLLNLIEQDPEVLGLIERKLNTSAGTPAPTPLQAPVKPTEYNPFDNDPNSESYKYRVSLEDYRDKKIEYLEQQSVRQQEMVQQQIAQAQQEAQARSQMAALQETLVSQHGLTPEEVPVFIKTMSSPQSVTLDNLVKFHRMLNQQAQTQPRAAVIQQQRQNRSVIPMPPTVGVQTQQGVSENDAFTESVRSWIKKPVQF